MNEYEHQRDAMKLRLQLSTIKQQSIKLINR
jgi:hypothetical protein